MNICVYGSSSNKIDKDYITAGEILGEEMAKRGHTLIYGGGANGLMGAVARGAKRQNGKIIGVAPSFFQADGVLFKDCTEFINTSTMRERKQIMEERSDAFIMTPGGIGTFEEFFEILTLKQLARHNKAITVLNTKGYYDSINDLLRNTASGGFMAPASLTLYTSFKSPEETLDFLENYIPEKFDISKMKHIGKAN